MKETLDSVVTPSVRDTILARALAVVNRDELPTEPRALEEFLHGPLHDTLVKALGPELGLSVSTELERITQVAARDTREAKSRTQPPPRAAASDTVRPGARNKSHSGAGSRRKLSRSTLPSPDVLPPGSVARTDERWAEKERRGIAPTLPAARRMSTDGMPATVPRPRRESARPSKGPLPVSDDFPRGVARALGVVGTASVAPTAGGNPTVLLASTDPEMLRLFRAWLELRADVEPAGGATALLVRLSQISRGRTVIVLDGKNPSVRPLTLAALAEEFPAGTTVVLWGVQAHLHARMCTITAAAEKWAVYAGDATTNEIVAECARIVG